MRYLDGSLILDDLVKTSDFDVNFKNRLLEMVVMRLFKIKHVFAASLDELHELCALCKSVNTVSFIFKFY